MAHPLSNPVACNRAAAQWAADTVFTKELRGDFMSRTLARLFGKHRRVTSARFELHSVQWRGHVYILDFRPRADKGGAA